MSLDKIVGAFRGLAIGDALGAPVEFKPMGTFPKVTDFLPTEGWDLAPGQWTDDTAQAICLADAMLAHNGYDSYAVMDEYSEWYFEGKNTPHQRCFDCGIQTASAIKTYAIDPVVRKTTQRHYSAGNGVVMRMAPAAISALTSTQRRANRLFAVQARETHYCQEAEEAAVIFGNMLLAAFNSRWKDDIFAFEVPQDSYSLLPALRMKHSPAIVGGGYVRDSLLTAVECFTTTNSFEECVLKAVNYGNDADTTAAVAGQLAGAFYGDTAIPERWKSNLWQSERIADLARELFLLEPLILRTRFEGDVEFSLPLR